MKPRLYLIPGTMCTEALWAPVAAALADPVEPVHLSIPQSPDLAATVDALAGRIGEDGAMVAGFSLGGYLAAALAARHPARIGRLMLVASAPCPVIPSELAQRQAAIDWVLRHGYKGLSRTKARQLVGGGEDMAHVIDTVLAMDAELGEAVFLHQMQVTTAREDLGPALSARMAVGLRLALAYSAEDPLLDPDWFAHFAAANPGAGSHPVAGRSHLLPLTHTAWLAELMAGWAEA